METILLGHNLTAVLNLAVNFYLSIVTGIIAYATARCLYQANKVREGKLLWWV